MPRKIELSIILPVFNEEKNIPKVINEFKKISKDINLEVIFVEDGGSTDKSREILKEQSKKNPFVKSLFVKERGYGVSLFRGLKQAKGEYVGWSHADLQTPPTDNLRAFSVLKKQKNPKKTYIKGRRYGRPLFDIFFTLGMSFFESLLLGKILFDINAQPNLFHRSFLTHVKNPPQDFSFDLYAYHLAKSKGYSVIRFPVYFGRRQYGESAWNHGVKDKWKFIKRTLRYSLNLKKEIRRK